MTEQKKSWEKRLSGQADELAADFVQSLSIDKRLYKYDIVGSIAHAKMLAAQKLISRDEFERIQKELAQSGMGRIARRTVAKYRQILDIPTARLRKKY